MGLFRRSGSDDPVAGPEVSVDDNDLIVARRVLARFERADHSDAIWDSLEAVAKAGGAPSLVDAVRAQQRTGYSGVDRPWRWLLAVAELAWDQEDNELVVRATLFAVMWQQNYGPTMQWQHNVQIGLDDPPEDVLAELYALALDVLQEMRSNAVVVNLQGDEITVDGATFVIATSAVNIADALDPEFLALARRLAATPPAVEPPTAGNERWPGSDAQLALLRILLADARKKYRVITNGPDDELFHFGISHDQGLGLVWLDLTNPDNPGFPWWARFTAGVVTNVPEDRHVDALRWANGRNTDLNAGAYLCLTHKETHETSIIFTSTAPGALFVPSDPVATSWWFATQMQHVAEKAGPDARTCHELLGGRLIGMSDLDLLVSLSLAT